MLAVGFVVLNRTLHGAFSDDVCGVVKQPNQFAWVDRLHIKEPNEWELSKQIALLIADAETKDPTDGAINFHKTGLKVDWSGKKLTKSVVIGQHQFYKPI